MTKEDRSQDYGTDWSGIIFLTLFFVTMIGGFLFVAAFTINTAISLVRETPAAIGHMAGDVVKAYKESSQ